MGGKLAVNEVIFPFTKFSLLSHSTFSSSVALKTMYVFCEYILSVFLDLFLVFLSPCPPYIHILRFIYFLVEFYNLTLR